MVHVWITLPETNVAHENLSFPSKYHQNGGFSMAMLVYRSVFTAGKWTDPKGNVGKYSPTWSIWDCILPKRLWTHVNTIQKTWARVNDQKKSYNNSGTTMVSE